jgi:hypothetical protein
MADDRTYVKLHDGFDEHPKVAGLSDKEFRTYIEALCYCARNLTDGEISSAVARKMAPPRVWATLTTSGLIEVADSGYMVHDYLEHQRSAEQVRQLKAARREAGKRGGEAKAKGLASARGVASDLPKQTPSKAVPDTEAEKEEILRISPEPDLFDEFWKLYPRREAKAAARKAWDKVIKKVDPQEVLDGLTAHAFSPDPQYRPLPASWLNAGRWEDEASVHQLRPADPHEGKKRMLWVESAQRWREIHPEEFVMGQKVEWR